MRYLFLSLVLILPVHMLEEVDNQPLKPAVRIVPPIQITATLPPPPTEPSLNPNNLTGCAEMEWYRAYVGLPVLFNSLGWRESNCRNDVRTFCCFGYWQEYISLWLSAKSSYRERLINECHISGVASIFGLSNSQKLAQACAAKVVYDISGLAPWRQ